MTWANQIRILRQQFEALGAIIGQNFIYALKPVVTALNTVMSKLIQFARVVSNSLGKIFGWKYEDTTGGIADDLEFGADAADDLGSGLGGAADKAKKLKQQLQGFDELNVLTTNTPSSGGGGGGGALGDTDVSATGGQWVRDTEDKFFESDLDSLYKLGDYIGTTLTNQLRSIEWDKVYQGAKNFGSGLASFLNGLISVDLFSTTGATIAGALNTAIYTALSFGQTFDFEEFGLAIAEGINTFVNDFDFKAYAQTFNTWANGILDALITAFDNVNWDKVGTAIGDYLKEIDIVGLASKLIKLASKIIFALGDALMASFETAPLETAIVALFAGLKLVGIGGALGGAISSALGGGLSISVPKIVATVATLSIIANQADTRFSDDGADNLKNTGLTAGAGFVGAKVLGASNPLATAIAASLGTGKAGFEVGLNLGEILAIKSGDWELADYYADFKFSDMFDYSLSEYGDAVSHYGNTVVTFVYDMAVAQGNIGQSSKELSKSISEALGPKIAKGITNTTKVLGILGVDTKKLGKTWISTMEDINESGDVFGVLAEDIPEYGDIIVEGITTRWDNLKNFSTDTFRYINSYITGESKNTASNMANAYSGANEDIRKKQIETKNQVIRENKEMARSAINDWNSIKISSSDTTSDIVLKYKAMAKSNIQEVGNFKNTSISDFKGLKDSAIASITGLSDSAKSLFESARKGASTSSENMAKDIKNNIIRSKSHIEKENWYSSGVNLVAGLRNGLVAKWSSTSSDGLVGKIVSLASGLTAALKRAFGIHSPSRLWRDDIGYYLAEGLRLGVVGEENHITRDIVSMGNRLTNSFSGALTLATPSSLSNGYNFGVTSTMSHQFSADTSMTSNIADGVRQGLSASQAEQNALLREQNELLYQLLQKETISSDDVYNVVVNKNRDTFNRTGFNPLFA